MRKEVIVHCVGSSGLEMCSFLNVYCAKAAFACGFLVFSFALRTSSIWLGVRVSSLELCTIVWVESFWCLIKHRLA